MTSRRARAALTIGIAFALVACDTGSRIPGLGGSQNDVSFRIVNTTGTALDLTSSGQPLGGSGHVNAGTSSACIRIDPSTTTAVGLREAGAPSDVGGFVPALVPRASYTVVAYTSDVGTTQALTLSDAFVPTSGLAGLRIVDVAPGLGSLDVYVTPQGGALAGPSTASVGYGGDTGYFDANPGTSQVRFTRATTTTLVFDAGAITVAPGQLSTLVLAQPGGAAAAPVSVLVPAC